MEVWRDVVGYEGRYEVSNLGRIRSTAYRGNGSTAVMKATVNSGGYHVVTLGKERKQHRVHVLVLEAFVGKRPEGMQGCHDNSDKSNNALSNLRWDTPKGNIADRKKLFGETNYNSKLTDIQVAEIRKRRHAGEKLRQLSEEFGVSLVRISQIANKAA